MGKDIKITVPKKKKRIPLPAKPPKIEKDKKAYDRKKEKDKIRKKRMNDRIISILLTFTMVKAGKLFDSKVEDTLAQNVTNLQAFLFL